VTTGPAITIDQTDNKYTDIDLNLVNRAVNEYSDIRISDGSEIFGFNKEKTNIRSQK